MRIKRTVARLVPVALLASLLVLVGGAPAHADPIPATNWPPASLSDIPAASTVVTDPSGGTTVGCPAGNNPAKVFRQFSSTGAVVQNQSVGDPIGTFCTGNATVGKDGTVYVGASSASGSVHYVQAWKNNSMVWSYTIPCGMYGTPWAMAMGANGNLYFVVFQGGGSCNSTQIIGLTPTAQSGSNPPVPRVVMNIPLYVPGIRGNGLSAYSDGLVLYARNNTIQYVSYSGAVAAPVTLSNVSTSAGDYWFDATVNGRVFVPNAASAAQSVGCSEPGNNSLSVTAIGPDGTAWTTPQFGECTYVHQVRPMPSGGFAMMYTHTNFVGGPPTEKMTVFGPDGRVLWAKGILGVGSTGHQVMAVDLQGNVALQSYRAEWQTISGSTYQFPWISFVLVNGTTGQDVPGAQFTLRGDSTTTDGPSYMWGNGDPAIADGTAYVAAYQCTTLSHCDNGTTRLYAFAVPGLQMDYPRGAILAMEKPMRVYAALGDSFSSGEGDAPFEDGTDVPYSGSLADYNLCHRSTTAYARLLAGDKALRLSIASGDFRACSGATSVRLTTNWPDKNLDDSPGPNTKEGEQRRSLGSAVDVVTITIGGNDAGFSDFVGRCVLADCSSDATRQEFLGKNGRVTLLNATLAGAYEEILRDAPNATVYVVGYPQLLPARDCSKPGMGLLNTAVKALVGAAGSAKLPVATRAKIIQKWLAEQNRIHLTLDEVRSLVLKPSISFTKSEQTIAKDLVTDLDLKIQAVVQQVDAGRGRLVYVDPQGKTSPFTGHELCTATPYFNGLTVNPSNPAHDLSYSFHPNKLGQSADAQLLRPFLVPAS